MRIHTILPALLLSCSAGVFAEEAATAAPSADESKPVPEHLQKTCLRETGSRIPHRHGPDDCLAVHGSAYNRDDLESGGQALVGEGLWRLDPALTISRSRR